MGFWVASTKKGVSRLMVCPPAVTWRSCMACSRAAWVLGGVRLISSARMTLAKTGPRTNWKRRWPVPLSSSRISLPVMSLGIRSGVNWMRLKLRSMTRARLLISSVLARPGTPSSSTWPPANRAIIISSTTWSWPTMTLAISARMAW